jgi:hypothetical protein
MLRLLAILSFIVPTYTLGQEDNSSFGKVKINKNLCLRTELGWNKSWFTSLGVSYVYSSINSHSPYILAAYASAEANLVTYGSYSPFYGYKAGVQFGGILLAYSAELRYNTDHERREHIIFTPKAGLTFYGHINLLYGYNIFRSGNNIFGVSRSQLSLNVNLNRRIFKESFIPTH